MSELFITDQSGGKSNIISLQEATITLANNENYVYDGTEKTRSIASIVIDGQTLVEGRDYIVVGNKGTNAGTYIISAFGIMNYNDVISAEWTIAKAQSSITATPSAMEIRSIGNSDTSTITYIGDGELSVSSSNEGIATASLDENIVTVEDVGAGSATITITISEGRNYLGTTATIDVTTLAVSNILEENTWDSISRVSKAGEGALYWNVGDSKAIIVNGKIGDYLTLNNQTMYVFILGFNHIDGGVEDNNIMWGCFKNGSKNIGLRSEGYGNSYTDRVDMNMNHWGNYNYGGWKGCDLRYDILGATEKRPTDYGTQVSQYSRLGYNATNIVFTNPKANTLMAALPNDLRSIMRLRTHYCDNHGSGNDGSYFITSVIDGISLMMEFEVFGSRTSANSYEKDKQTQFTYFKNGNSKICYRHDNTGNTITCCLGSSYSGYSDRFISMGDSSTSPSNGYANIVRGIFSVFKT